MASSLSPTTQLPTSPLLTTGAVSVCCSRRRAPMRVYCSASPPPDPLSTTHSQLMGLRKAVSPSVVEILSYFAAPQSREIPHSARRCTGVIVESTLIVTSAGVIGQVSTVYNSERATILNHCYVARTIALTIEETVFRVVPLAIDFSGDVAVLEVLKSECQLPPPCTVANGVAQHGSRVLGIARHANRTLLMTLQVNATETSRPKAPWPLKDEVEWVDYGCGGSIDMVIDALPNMAGSPWFDSQGEVVGMVSWSAAYRNFNGYEIETRVNSYAVPPSRISFLVDYAKTKGPDDPIVVDSGIDALILPDFDADVVERCVPRWTKNASLMLLSETI